MGDESFECCIEIMCDSLCDLLPAIPACEDLHEGSGGLYFLNRCSLFFYLRSLVEAFGCSVKSRSIRFGECHAIQQLVLIMHG